MENYLFSSERLGFRTWREEDIDPFAQLCADPVVMEYFPKLLTRAETEASVNRFRKHYADRGFCFFPVDELATGTFIGFIGMQMVSFEASFSPAIEIGWRLQRTAWGKGFATEGALRCLEYGFAELAASAIYSFTAVINLRSERVMQKIGMSRVGLFDHPLVADPRLKSHVLYKVEKGAFRGL
jgi:RimJ/RimL family protein N-acetyltransferase